MQLIVTLGEGGVVQIKCPGCESLLKTVREQDWRLHIMLHPEAECRWSNQKFRVDRLSGYAEPWPGAAEEAQSKEAKCGPTEGATPTSTITSAPSPRTTSTKPTQPTRRVIPARVRGRIRR